MENPELWRLAGAQLWQVTVLIILVGAVARWWRGRNSHLVYLLWLLVAVKAVTPPLVATSSGIFSRAQTWFASNHVSERQGGKHGLAEPTSGEATAHASSSGANSTLAVQGSSPAPVPRPNMPSLVRSRVTWRTMVGWGWLMGTLLCGAWIVKEHLVLRRALRKNPSTPDAERESLLRTLALSLGVNRPVKLRIIPQNVGPAVMGLWHPTILLPSAMAENERSVELRLALAHELIHVRRGDLWVGCFQSLVQMIWWFHPLVWWANRQTSRQCELCCDEAVIAELECRPGDYTKSLLNLLERKLSWKMPFGTPGIRPVDVTARRLRHLLRPGRSFRRRAAWWHWLLGPGLAALILPGGVLQETTAARLSKPATSLATAPKTVVPAPADSSSSADIPLREAAEAALRKAGGAVEWNGSGSEKEAVRIVLDFRATDETTANLEAFPEVKSLQLNSAKITGQGLRRVKALTHLTDLELLAGRSLKDEDLAVLEALTNLTGLRLRFDSLTGAGLRHLAPLRNLRSLDLDGNRNLADAGLESLRLLPALKHLDLSETAVGDAGVEALVQCPQLQSVTLEGTRITDRAVSRLSQMKQLEGLGLMHTRVTVEGLKPLLAVKSLKALTLAGDQVTAQSLKMIGAMSSLKSLWLVGPELHDDGLEALQNLSGLEDLIVEQSKVTDAGLLRLQHLTGLTRLGLSRTGVGDAGLRALQGMTNLTWLYLQDTAVSDAGLRALAELKHLKYVEAVNTAVTREGADWLQSQVPGLYVNNNRIPR
jgi:beta-lactamase regulating signal transducer with metallopeptidase domain/Leucine-rich repeat (LRR) protein